MGSIARICLDVSFLGKHWGIDEVHLITEARGEHAFGEGKVFGATYTFLYQPMEIDSLPLPGGVVLDGEYERSYLHFLGPSLSIEFGKLRWSEEEEVPRADEA